jgi:NitT/TauT family transport system substrate-binding protein
MARKVLMRGVLRGLGGCLAAALFAFSAPAQARQPKLVLSGPFAAVSFPLIHMVESGALKDVAETVEFRSWKDPDQLRVLALDAKSDVDFVAMPTNVAANLYNRGVKLQLINVSTWGVLWMVSREANLKTLADFKGKEILMPFRADMPDIVFQVLAEKQGLDVKRDFTLRYVGSPLDAMQMLITRRADHALLAEPAVSVALRKTKSFPVSVIAPELYRSANLQEEWGRVTQRPARIPQAGMVALGRALADPGAGRKIPEGLCRLAGLVRKASRGMRQARRQTRRHADPGRRGRFGARRQHRVRHRARGEAGAGILLRPAARAGSRRWSAASCPTRPSISAGNERSTWSRQRRTTVTPFPGKGAGGMAVS